MVKPKPVHLYFRPPYHDPKTGKLRKKGVWVIVDGSSKRVTGCSLEDRSTAERLLNEYLAEKHEPDRKRGQGAADVLVSDVISVYLRDRAPEQASPEKAAIRAVQLLDFWQGKTLDDINGRSCRDYVAYRCAMPWKSARPEKTGKPPRMVTAAGARRELEDLRAAVNYHHGEGLHREHIKVTLPSRSEARDRFLTRQEAAKIVMEAYRRRELRNGRPTGRRTAHHIARFLLIGLYTGTRAGAIGSAAFEQTDGAGWVDIEAGVFYRQAVGKRKTNKRQTPVRLPKRLLAHIRRWKRVNPDQKYVIEWNGQPVREVNKGFGVVAKAAGFGSEVTPHTLRHTCATWLMQRGASVWDAAGYLGMTTTLLERTYGHHHPSFQSRPVAPPPLDEIWSPQYHPTIVTDEPYVQAKAASA
ncbi:site-specific integrase [Pelagibacterium sediminicola]|uniref:site-specific integrase n=1 Tax=Pelagibacterium sediminicola TaxID=2248761 RepID=UPI000E314CD7|nr:site-specific integrase [Pelagibacterium sediminicola]